MPQPPKNKREMNWGRFSKTLAFWIMILLIPLIIMEATGARSDQSPKINYTQYRDELSRDNIKKVTIQAGKYVQGEFRSGANINGRTVRGFTVNLPVSENSDGEIAALTQHGVVIEAQDQRPSITAWIVNFLPWLLLIGFYLFLFRQMQAGGAQAFLFGKAEAKLVHRDTPKVNVAGGAGPGEGQQEP